jgi:hypothetical protein
LPADCEANYQVFCWHGIWFPVYCCYELASINDRSIFISLADLTIAVEYNKDITFFSNIIESLCRDLHCFCVQTNSSDYGDSRVIQPTKSELRDILKTKGGNNSTILTAHLDIKNLRESQLPEYEKFYNSNSFKPIPPNFDIDIVRAKINGAAWELIIDKTSYKQ